MRKIIVQKLNDKCVCRCPKNFNVIKKFHDLKGIWNNNNKWWEFDIKEHETIKNLMIKYFGVDNGEYESCELIIKNLTDRATLKGIIVSGFELCRAWGKKTGAKTNDNVILLSGDIDSGGSNNYWYTKCTDATFKILNFPITMLKNPSIKRLNENEQLIYLNNY